MNPTTEFPPIGVCIQHQHEMPFPLSSFIYAAQRQIEKLKQDKKRRLIRLTGSYTTRKGKDFYGVRFGAEAEVWINGCQCFGDCDCKAHWAPYKESIYVSVEDVERDV